MAGTVQQSPQDQWIIQQALTQLGQIKNLPGDENYLYNFVGVNPVFNNGAQALQVIRDKNIRVEFGDMGDSPAHAQWMADQNLIMINQRYRGDTSPDTIRAISEAIYHEAGHAKDGDDKSSIQEETDCLALNTMGHRSNEAQSPDYAQAASRSRLMADGVALYPKLFFDADPAKQALINRIALKYGDLPLTSPNHAVPSATAQLSKPIASAVAAKVETQPTQQDTPESFQTTPANQTPASSQSPAASPAPGQQLSLLG
jgi:hypothetical protein